MFLTGIGTLHGLSGRGLEGHERARERLDSCAGDHGIGCLGNVSLPFCGRWFHGGIVAWQASLRGVPLEVRRHCETRERAQWWQRGREAARSFAQHCFSLFGE